MKTAHSSFDEHAVLHDLKHFLPAQAPLKDFIHHNTLHAFEQLNFQDALERASEIFGYKVTLTLDEYRELYHSGKISPVILNKVLGEEKGFSEIENWTEKLLNTPYKHEKPSRIGQLRSLWKREYNIDLDVINHPLLFRFLCNYLDQGISIAPFPIHKDGFLASLRQLELNSAVSLFKGTRAAKFLLDKQTTITQLLKIIVHDESRFTQYLFDQQFSHQGWSGMVSAIEDLPSSLLDPRKITLEEFIIFELICEIDTLDNKFGTHWAPLGIGMIAQPEGLFEPTSITEMDTVLFLWQKAFEFTYYDQVLSGLKWGASHDDKTSASKSFQALLCIDDRECSIRRYMEEIDPQCATFGTPGFFGVEFFYQPQNGNFYTKVCPAPVTPKYLIKETDNIEVKGKEHVFNKRSHSLLQGWLVAQTFGFWSALKLGLNLLKPSMSPATSHSFEHMHKDSNLSIEFVEGSALENELQIGFKVEEMAIRVENVLKSIGLVENFASIIYVIGHGSTSVNNTHYAGYDCGACSGRPGSVNARVLSFMGNHPKVRSILRERGIDIPASTQFVGALRDTSRDQFAFYDVNLLSEANKLKHTQNQVTFYKASDLNAKERSRRFESINSGLTPAQIHEKVKVRSVSLFEPRPELNHATNALCIVGRRALSKHLFLDRRSFMNSFDYEVDPEGNYLLNILNAVAPVCGGINLEYYFSRVDNQKLGAGTKLSHNVMGLFGVANGTDGDLRPGLPSQMIEVHDPIRLMVIVEHFPDVVLNVIQRNPATFNWFEKQWIHLSVIHPTTKEIYYFNGKEFTDYEPVTKDLAHIKSITPFVETEQDNLPVFILEPQNSTL